MADVAEEKAATQRPFDGDWVQVEAKRLAGNPLIRPEMLPGDDGENINGPSLLRVPGWIDKPLGKYYLYFAHHAGRYIRMAYADALAGPWTVYEGGVLQLDELPFESLHIASPEIVVDDERRTIRMYFHGAIRRFFEGETENGWSGQTTHVALSADGLHFEARAAVLAPFYLRVFRREGQYWGIAKWRNASVLCRSEDGLKPFEKGPSVFPCSRHWAVLAEGDTLWVFFSRIGDAPEHIGMTRLDMRSDWSRWEAESPPVVSVIRPETAWEGANRPNVASSSGLAREPVRQLRDPCVYEEDGRLYLFYSVAGESGIAVVELRFNPPENGPLAASPSA